MTGMASAKDDDRAGSSPAGAAVAPQLHKELSVPFFRPELGEEEINEVVCVLRSGWLTTGPRVRDFEHAFAASVGARSAVAVNSCTAALHLAVEALGLRQGQAVLVPTMTFAATAEVVRYQNAIPILVDCDSVTCNLDLGDAQRKVDAVRKGTARISPKSRHVVGIIPVHVGGLMMDIRRVRNFAETNNLWVVEDAAHSFPSAYREAPDQPWRRCGEETASITCFSFYANKTITTGEGGMAVCSDKGLADHMRSMSLHGLSRDAWSRYSGTGSWDYRIVAPGFKYNLPDPLAAIGIHQLAKAEEMRIKRQAIADFYRIELGDVEEIELPPCSEDRIHSWHLFPIRLRLDRLSISRNEFLQEMKEAGIACSVHWRPLHLHRYYEETFGWRPEDLPTATSVWSRLVSLPIFPGLRSEEMDYIAKTVRRLCRTHIQ
jgi:dTDP-4-amino-4,6-dideoxygalactose transaminase